MKSYISRKFPLATRKTVLTFALRSVGVSIFSGLVALELEGSANIDQAANRRVTRHVRQVVAEGLRRQRRPTIREVIDPYCDVPTLADASDAGFAGVGNTDVKCRIRG